MMVALRVNVTLGTVQALRNVESFDVISRFKVARLPGLDLVVSRLAQKYRQPSDLDPHPRTDQQIRIARSRDEARPGFYSMWVLEAGRSAVGGYHRSTQLPGQRCPFGFARQDAMGECALRVSERQD